MDQIPLQLISKEENGNQFEAVCSNLNEYFKHTFPISYSDRRKAGRGR